MTYVLLQYSALDDLKYFILNAAITTRDVIANAKEYAIPNLYNGVIFAKTIISEKFITGSRILMLKDSRK